MTETPFFFERGPAQLFAVYHEPAGGVRRLPFLFCHPFAEEKLWAHRSFVTFARELARKGHPVLRFDYFGNGDSDGVFADSSMDTALADIAAALDVLKVRSDATRFGLMGLRVGASLAFRTAARRDDIEALVLWAPVVDGERYLQDLLRINLTAQMLFYREVRQDREELGRILASGGTVNVEGYDITGTMSEQLSAISLAAENTVPASPCFLAQIERNENALPSRELEALRARLADSHIQVVREEPFWKEIQRFYDTAPALFARTLEWLEGR